MINKTQLNIPLAEKRGIVHRDYLAHCLRWSHVLKYAKVGQNWLDIGCGDFMLALTLYTNRYKPKQYVGIDMRKLEDKVPQTNFHVKFMRGDFAKLSIIGKWDNIVCFEMLEHVEKKHGKKILAKIADIAGKNTNIFISTPNYNGEKAGNHVYEWAYTELNNEIKKYFIIEQVYGTFASQSDIKSVLTKHEKDVFNSLQVYYDSNLLSIMFAPTHPQQSRNCLWHLRKK